MQSSSTENILVHSAYETISANAMGSQPLKRIYFDTNVLYRWPHMPSDIPSMLGVANWVNAELYMPKIVEDELEGQYVRAIRDLL